MQATLPPVDLYAALKSAPSSWNQTIYGCRLFGPADHRNLTILCQVALPRIHRRISSTNRKFTQNYAEAVALYEQSIVSFNDLPWYKRMFAMIPGRPPLRRYASYNPWMEGVRLQTMLEQTTNHPDAFYYEDCDDLVQLMLDEPR